MFPYLFHGSYFNNSGYRMENNLQSPDHTPLSNTVKELGAIEEDDKLLKRSSDIAAMVDYWDLVDDLIAGYDAVKQGGSKYLPKFHEEESEEYSVRLNLTKFTNVYHDIIQNLSAKPFEEEVSLNGDTIPDLITQFIEDVDGAGNNLTVFASNVFFNGINSAIDWIFIDYPVANPDIRTVADQKRAGVKPFWSRVLGRNVLEAKSENIDGKQVISYIRIFEPGVTELDRVRIFMRDPDGKILWELWEKIAVDKVTPKSQFKLIGQGVLSIDVVPLVPFITGRRDGTTWKIHPAMRDAADLQIKLYQAESGLEYVTNLAGYPMLAANGLRPEMDETGKKAKKVKVGPAKILWGIPDGNGNHGEWKYIEPSATSMEFLQKKVDKTKEDMRELGKQPLTATAGNLTVITAAVAAGKARSVVSAWALLLKDALENALMITDKYMNTGYSAEVNVYNEFDSFADGNSDIDALNSARKNGDLSQETYWFELKRRKVLSPEFDNEKERERLLDEVPVDDPGLIDDPEAQPGNVA